MNCNPDGTVPNPTIHLHPPLIFAKPASMPYAITWPNVIATTLITTILPLNRVGESSWIYIGAIQAAIPTPQPMRNRLPIMSQTVLDTA